MSVKIKKVMALSAASILLLLASGCMERAANYAQTDAWRGEWTGPEGTALTITGTEGTYRITVRNLDGPLSYDARAVQDSIEFERAGRTELIRATDGTGTGMKWLADKHDCLVIRPGEGFCRD